MHASPVAIAYLKIAPFKAFVMNKIFLDVTLSLSILL